MKNILYREANFGGFSTYYLQGGLLKGEGGDVVWHGPPSLAGLFILKSYRRDHGGDRRCSLYPCIEKNEEIR